VDKHVLIAAVGLDKAEALLGAEPFYDAVGHVVLSVRSREQPA
jgi:hypothetical protein